MKIEYFKRVHYLRKELKTTSTLMAGLINTLVLVVTRAGNCSGTSITVINTAPSRWMDLKAVGCVDQ